MLISLLVVFTVSVGGADVLDDITERLPSSPPHRPEFAEQRPEEMTVVDVEGLNLDEKITLMALQGLVNRRAPRIFIVSMKNFNRDADIFWVDRLQTKYGIKPKQASFEEVLAKYGSELNGLIVYRPDEPQTENVACMVGALLQLLPVAPEVAKECKQATGLQVKYDLKGCFEDNLDAARWAAENLFEALQPQDIACIAGRSGRLVRDYAVVRGAFMCDLSSAPDAPEERALKGQILDRLPDDSIQWGWVCGDNEGQYVEYASQYNVRTLCTTNAPNLSFLTQIRPLREELPRRSEPNMPEPEEKIYLSFVLSDGDSIPILLTRQWYRWDEEARGEIPFGWEMQPLFNDMAPVVQEYYFETATENDEFIIGPSGAGYVHPSSLADPEQFFADTEQGLDELSASVVGVIDDGYNAEGCRLLSRGIPAAECFFHGWGGAPTILPIMAEGTPHLHYRICPPRPDGEKDAEYYEKVAERIRRVAEIDGLPCCVPVHLSCYWSGPNDVPRILEVLGDQPPVEVILPGAMAKLARKIYTDRVFIVAPDEMEIGEGLAGRLPITLRSVSDRPQDVRLAFEAEGCRVAPAARDVTVPPHSEVQRTISLHAEAGAREPLHLKMSATGGGASLQQDIDVVAIPTPGGIPDGEYALQSAWEAENCSHDNGHELQDQAAFNGRAWAAIEGKDKAEGVTIWGQYEPLQAGEYAVAFRCRTEEGGPAGTLAHIDAFDYRRTQEGKDGTLARAAVKAAELPADREYTDVWLKFKLEQKAKVEYRLRWSGEGSIVTDRIVVLRREGTE